ncbi:aldose 1-epimerase [Haloactinopolyspora alba]|uniref:Aldose 1-epimerase n=1 Tax=Haloactinopolyspora alba TaxID=648780 RepID=A0A2P8E5E0_9ACTN|nr:aldose 1-epimerase family protein [Haloactinopolyspora alba]PSL04685.1 aldose 1-epimerase [Haloactinopolyspora alba]
MSPSGSQLELHHGDYTAVVTEVGATLRELRVETRPLVVGFGPDEIRPAHRGAVLAPWPNRIADGRYSFGGVSRQLPVTEPARGNALHGLVTWVRWQVVEHEAGHAVLRHRLVPQPGYPHPLELTVRYRLDDDGLHWSVEASNTGDSAAPYGCAPHPYLVAGDGRVDDWTLELPASEYLEVTPDRLLPVERASVDGTALDFRDGRRVGDTFVDHAFTALGHDPDGRSRARLRDGTGQGVEMSWDATRCPWIQIHTGDRPGEAAHRAGMAVEPMTCPPDAFNSGTDVVALAPGASHQATWTISALSPSSH